ncbi:hypothetical protein Mgra_00002233 [Meloidogyne graminicola]|uniref:Uncharacterized protein n=1 Tax=Meloidogyne graminicola TaxID=189291 RepID=A0A8S9ZYQ9_9BILA|nr:hypothetical protein Mgra_00002233 [Meloidogyne graminicola]
MDPILIATPKHFVNGNVIRIGLKNNELFVAYRDKTILEIWSINCYIPSSWKQLIKKEYYDLFYIKCTLSIKQNYIFILVAAFFGIDGGVCIYRYNLNNNYLEEFLLDLEESYKFEEVTLERVGLECGNKINKLFLYDRTMVTGEIPFWNINLNEEKKTFSINSLPLLDEENICLNCIRFPIVLNGDKRIALRISNDYQVFIYNSENECWELFNIDNTNTGLDLSSFDVRGLNETFGRNWHQYKYSLLNCGCISSLDKRLETLCFLSCSNSKIAFVNKHIIGKEVKIITKIIVNIPIINVVINAPLNNHFLRKYLLLLRNKLLLIPLILLEDVVVIVVVIWLAAEDIERRLVPPPLIIPSSIVVKLIGGDCKGGGGGEVQLFYFVVVVEIKIIIILNWNN